MTGFIFISFSSQDRPYVERLAFHLRDNGIPYWFDERIRTGETISHEIEAAIGACAAVAVVMSPWARDSFWVAGELEHAGRLGRPILPLLLAGDPLLKFGGLHYEDVTGSRMPSPDFIAELASWTGAPEIDVTAAATTDPAAGVIVAGDGRGVWAWAGVRFDFAADLTAVREYQQLTEADRLLRAVGEETAWLAGLWERSDGACFDLRYRTDPSQRQTSCAIVGRVHGPDELTARAAALRLSRRLAEAPQHVRASPITDQAELGGWLAPFEAAPDGIADIRKRIRVERPRRPDAGVKFYLVMEPFVVTAPSWEPLWRSLLDHPYPVLLSIHATAVEIGQSTTSALNQLAGEYDRLARAGEAPPSLFSSGRAISPDPFAADAARLFHDAARRYTGRVFRVRVTLASPARLPDALTELAGHTMSPPDRPQDAGALTVTLRGPAHVVVRPGPDELATARRNLATADNLAWDGQYLGQLPTPPPPAVRLAAGLMDAREASAVARLPVAPFGMMPGFPVRRRSRPGQ